MFSNAHHLVITGGQFHSGPMCIQHASSHGRYLLQPFLAASQMYKSLESSQGIVPGMRVVRLNHGPSQPRAGYQLISGLSLGRSLSRTFRSTEKYTGLRCIVCIPKMGRGEQGS